MASLIEQAKQIPASTIAEQQGISLKQSGEKYWTCCPFHSERHASLCFFPDGGWYCFGCHAGGDSIDLLAQLKNISLKEAAEEICGKAVHSGSVQPAPIVLSSDPKKKYKQLCSWERKQVKRLKKTIRQADEYTGQYSVETADAAWDDPIFRAAIMAKLQARNEIDELDAADGIELEWMMMQEGGRRSG